MCRRNGIKYSTYVVGRIGVFTFCSYPKWSAKFKVQRSFRRPWPPCSDLTRTSQPSFLSAARSPYFPSKGNIPLFSPPYLHVQCCFALPHQFRNRVSRYQPHNYREDGVADRLEICDMVLKLSYLCIWHEVQQSLSLFLTQELIRDGSYSRFFMSQYYQSSTF